MEDRKRWVAFLGCATTLALGACSSPQPAGVSPNQVTGGNGPQAAVDSTTAAGAAKTTASAGDRHVQQWWGGGYGSYAIGGPPWGGSWYGQRTWWNGNWWWWNGFQWVIIIVDVSPFAFDDIIVVFSQTVNRFTRLRRVTLNRHRGFTNFRPGLTRNFANRIMTNVRRVTNLRQFENRPVTNLRPFGNVREGAFESRMGGGGIFGGRR